MSSRHSLAVLASLLFTAIPALSHEFWIEPEEYQVQSGSPLKAQFRNGQNFKGTALAYFDKRNARLEQVIAGQAVPYAGRMGDIPAIETTAPLDGLLVVVHQTAPQTLTYKTWEKFKAFAEHKDFPDIRARHRDRGLPESGFAERYTRYAKALIAVGDGAGSDRPASMETEFVALTNPYTDDPENGLHVQLLYRGKPRADAQIEVFEKAPDDTVTINLQRTDSQGQAIIPIKSGHEYLLDAVVLRPLSDDSPEVWESLWAAMTFAVP
ncbi:DUF4198 domain-containing protein [Sedimentitalea todarodis]|uniref:DUF4198 domain-containing protein n=1 Tax=Sedimentitalea todarodis TaxID=1631240 RepID=A0ABU3VJS7_9RHOB|nr:DUF4198 domain-containing protein [Sedimentitalea todarodis]MDU9006406.1 DUF4198 domain-containing protein [Sedimentitalea todarodis]